MMMSRAWLQMVFLLLLLLLFVVAFPNTCSAFPIRSSSSPWKRVSLVPQREKHSSYFSFDTNFPTTIIGLYNNHHCQHDEINDEKAAPSSESAQQVELRTRRLFVKNTVVVALFVTTGVVVWMGGCPLLSQQVQPAYATYSAYSHREDDWKQRQASGEVQFTSAASLRSQLKEMVPQNDSGRLLFCPNGPTAAVSPLMENKCGDKLAMPSVYGRTEDTMGNSIPGFAGGFYSSGISQSISSSSSSADTGGLPSYSQYTTSGE